MSYHVIDLPIRDIVHSHIGLIARMLDVEPKWSLLIIVWVVVCIVSHYIHKGVPHKTQLCDVMGKHCDSPSNIVVVNQRMIIAIVLVRVHF